MSRALLENDLDANGHAVSGLITAVNPPDAVPLSQMTTAIAAEATARNAAILVETNARIAADALIPGTITALTGDVTASGTGSVASALANIPQSVLLTRLAALTADPSFNGHKLTGGADATSPTGFATLRQIAAAANLLEVDGLSTGTRQLTALAFPASGAVLVSVLSLKDFFYLDRTSTATADGITIVTALGGTGRWLRMRIADPFWATVTDWYIDPAGTFSPAGNDEAVGDATHPIKSMAEWRRRVQGARYSFTVVIHALSGSTVLDDGLIDGVTTIGGPSFTSTGKGRVVILGTTTVVFAGTVGAGSVVSYSGNNRATIVDSTIPTSWTVSGGISTTTSSRFIRRVGGGVQAPVLKDMGSKTAMIGHGINISETDVDAFINVGIVSFTIGDSYEVVSRLKWPALHVRGNVWANLWCLDVSDTAPGQAPAVPYDDFYVLCGVLGPLGSTFGALQLIGCVVTGPSVATTYGLVLFGTAFVNSLLAPGSTQWHTNDNVFVNTPINMLHGMQLLSTGILRFFDCSTTCLSVRYASRVGLNGLVGSGNTSKLLNAGDGAGSGAGLCQIQSGQNCTAITSDPLPFVVSGVSYAAPGIFDGNTGNAIFAG